MFICYVSLAIFVFFLQNGHELIWRDFNTLFAKNLGQLFLCKIAQTMLHQMMDNIGNNVSVALLSLD
jgi:hypothetical protein